MQADDIDDFKAQIRAALAGQRPAYQLEADLVAQLKAFLKNDAGEAAPDHEGTEMNGSRINRCSSVGQEAINETAGTT